MISGCMDNQTSADAYNVQGKREFSGAMTSCLLLTLSQDKKIFNVMYKLRSLLRQKGFTQYPQLASSYVITDTESLC